MHLSRAVVGLVCAALAACTSPPEPPPTIIVSLISASDVGPQLAGRPLFVLPRDSCPQPIMSASATTSATLLGQGVALRLPAATAASVTPLERDRGVVFRDPGGALLAIGYADRIPVLSSVFPRGQSGFGFERSTIAEALFLNTLCQMESPAGELRIQFRTGFTNPAIPASPRFFNSDFRATVRLRNGTTLNVLGYPFASGGVKDSLFATRLLLGQLVTLQ